MLFNFLVTRVRVHWIGVNQHLYEFLYVYTALNLMNASSICCNGKSRKVGGSWRLRYALRGSLDTFVLMRQSVHFTGPVLNIQKDIFSSASSVTHCIGGDAHRRCACPGFRVRFSPPSGDIQTNIQST